MSVPAAGGSGTGGPATGGLAWADAVVAAGGQAVAARDSGRELDARYAEAHRRYHTGAHVAAVLRDAAGLAESLSLTAAERTVLTLAVCAHDVVYDAAPGVDERASARWATERLAAAGVREEVSHRVAQLVLSTLSTLSHEAPAHDLVASALLDADLAVLAAPRARYDAYVAGVRAEYAHVPEPEWVVGRSAVLRSLADRPRLYRTRMAAERWQARARHNLARELADLARRDPDRPSDRDGAP